MIINIDLEFLEKKSLSPDEYCILACIYYNKNPKEVMITVPELSYADIIISGEFLKEDPNSTSTFSYSLTGDGLNLFEITDSFSFFIEEYRNLFPKGVKSGNGTPIKGDKQGISKKMEWFLRMYPEYSKTTILEATKIYVDQMARKAYAYMVQADYLIQKDNSSKLAALCEEYDVKTSNAIKSGEKRI